MSAQIIAFPRRKPLEWDELPAAWTNGCKSLYQYLTYDGEMTHAEAMAYVDSTHERDGLIRREHPRCVGPDPDRAA